MDIQGTLHLINDVQTFDSGFQKRQIVIKTDGQYPQTIPVNLLRDKVNLIDGYTVGNKVKAHIDIRGNEHNGKYYADIVCWKIEGEPTQTKTDDDDPF